MVCRISFTSVLTVVTLLLSLAPAIIIWAVFMDLMTSSVDLLRETTRDSTDHMAQSIQELLMAQAIEKFDDRLTEGDAVMAELLSMIETSGALEYDLRPSRFDIPVQGLKAFRNPPFNAMRGHPYFSEVAVFAGLLQNPTDAYATRLWWVAWVSFFLDVLRQQLGTRTLYCSTLAMAPDALTTTMNITQADPVTGKPIFTLISQTAASEYFVMGNEPGGWAKTLTFNPYIGQVELSTWQWLPAQNKTWMQIYISIGVSTISEELGSQLNATPDDRLVLFFRQPHGHMIAASHGKYFSHSDVDPRYINPLINPPNLSTYHLWDCTLSTDALIRQACQQLYSTYQSWTAIPVLRQETVLGGQRYWLATEYSTGALQCTVLMLKNRASVMGGIDATNAWVDRRVTDKKGVTFVILGVVSAIAVLLPLSVGLWLATRLYTLAVGMDRIAQLQFTTTAAPPTVFRELHRFQASFTQMERGLQAFGKFVPQAVVKVLIAGHMKANDDMHPETLTIMFADIEGFSTVCETVSPTVLVSVCTEYFEAMCSNIVDRHGTIDKFIGDCIMAIWNAPERLPGHERDAVAASLAMQSSIMELHKGWQQQDLPVLKFRIGIHTGVCLVGNFGCSYRVSYTCLGDGVNLSARLEALNKRFGTAICVSGATYQGCRGDFHFRRLAKVTVPGKVEVLPVYEVLCEADGIHSPGAYSPKAASPPGAVNHMEVETASDLPSRDGSFLPSNASPKGFVRIHSLNGLANAQSSVLAVDPYRANHVAYHWTHVDRSALLQYARQYEHAYEAMAAGNPSNARRILMARPILDVPDKAWSALAGQLEHCEAGQPWDGVFYFREK